MHPMERRLVRALEAGEAVSLATIGGVGAVADNAQHLARSPMLPEVVRLLVYGMGSATGEELESLEQVLVGLLGGVEDDLVLHEVVDVLDDTCGRRPRLDEALLGMFLRIVQDPSLPATTRAFALDGAFRRAVTALALRYKFLGALVSITATDDPAFLRLAMKIIGVSHTHWRSEGLVEHLHRLASIDEAAEEACYEIALAEMHEGLVAADRDEAIHRFESSGKMFGKVLDRRPDRPDACLYAEALGAVLRFAEGASTEEVEDLADEVSRRAAEILLWHVGEGDPPWLGARLAEAATWRTLSARLATVAARLDESAWYEPAAVIEQELLAAYTASRTLLFSDRDGAIETILAPRIEAGAASKRTLLEQWLARNPESVHAATAARLLAVLDLGESTSDAALPTPLERLLRLQGAAGFPHETAIFERCIRLLKEVGDYHLDGVQDLFDPILFLTLRFLSLRMDLSKATAVQVGYLFHEPGASPPHERRLQEDYQDYMAGLIPGLIDTERSNVAGGRADVVFAGAPHRLVVEVKRELRDASFDSIFGQYQGQATEYQNTNIRLGLLLVLDLTDKPGGAAHITEQVEARLVRRAGEHQDRGLVAVRVPGNRRRPSGVA